MIYKSFVYRDKGQAYLVPESMDAEIRGAIARGRGVNTAGRVIYALYEAPDEALIRKGGRIQAPAMVLRDGQPIAVRWYWQQQEHKRNHYGCKELGGGLCAVRRLRYFVWNYEKKDWELEPMVNKVSAAHEQYLSR